jgi:hypothetical protein
LTSSSAAAISRCVLHMPTNCGAVIRRLRDMLDARVLVFSPFESTSLRFACSNLGENYGIFSIVWSYCSSLNVNSSHILMS